MDPLSNKKISLRINVLKAARTRIEWTFNTFSRICISFSGGKDSTAMLHLAAEQARKKGRKFDIIFIDWEAQFSHTINHIEKMRSLYQDVIDHFYWVALPITTGNSVSQFQPEWQCWTPNTNWIRKPPADAITDPEFFPFYYDGITFESFMPAFSDWYSNRQPSAMMIGIRTDESYTRFWAIASQRKNRFADDKPWTTGTISGHTYNIYPICDWKTDDIWTYFSSSKKIYNPLYDLMFQAGVGLHAMRICEPFGPEQRQGLWLYHVLEPECWEHVCERVSGANTGSIYANSRGDFYARRQVHKPDNHTWHSYALFLLNSMPQQTAEHYRNKIAIYLRWYQTHGFPSDIPDEQEKDIGAKDVPSWRRICKVLLRNDYWCRSLSFSPNKPSSYERYNKRIQAKRKCWSII
ncbi:phosphoadenosine phosphosulfate reductase [Hafnia alvei]|uniref:phosphoadenosine phosphosulfate reductase n=1 Tax=Hafnia alvei TaxID=569 RepID=UPI00345DCD6D